MEFTEIIQINIKPVKENEGVDIITTNLYLDNGIFFLSERDYEYSDYKKNERTWIAAKKVCWRERDDLLGDEMIYMEKL